MFYLIPFESVPKTIASLSTNTNNHLGVNPPATLIDSRYSGIYSV